MEDQVTNNNLNESGETQNADQLQSVRAELITLAEKGEIKQGVHCKSVSVIPTPKSV